VRATNCVGENSDVRKMARSGQKRRKLHKERRDAVCRLLVAESLAITRFVATVRKFENYI
jgi:hypothetical protein